MAAMKSRVVRPGRAGGTGGSGIGRWAHARHAVTAGVMRWVRARGGEAVAFALPQCCPACGAHAGADTLLCAACLAAIPTLGMPLCLTCLVRGDAPDGCLRHPHARAWAAWVYDERAALVVQAFKFGGRRGLAGALAARLAAGLPAGLAPDLVTAVPLHPARRRERGYDQAEELARALAARLGAPYLPLLRRTRPTRPQSRLGPGERRRNVEGAIAVREPSGVRGRRTLVVDDVLTTGATLGECAAALAGAGAAPVAAALAWAA
jgi:ComF family protein